VTQNDFVNGKASLSMKNIPTTSGNNIVVDTANCEVTNIKMH